MANKTVLDGRNVKVIIDLTGMKKGLTHIITQLNSNTLNGMGGVLRDFAAEVTKEVLGVYVATASHSKAMLKRRIRLYGSVNPLDGVLGNQLKHYSAEQSGDVWRVLIGNPTLYPLGQGNPYYSYLQEFGTNGTTHELGWTSGPNPKPITHPGLPAREFLLAGANYGHKIVLKRINDAIRRWIKEGNRF